MGYLISHEASYSIYQNEKKLLHYISEHVAAGCLLHYRMCSKQLYWSLRNACIGNTLVLVTPYCAAFKAVVPARSLRSFRMIMATTRG